MVPRQRGVWSGGNLANCVGSENVSAGMIGAMTERGLPDVDTSVACPFVALEDDRDTRATIPDHGHRCYAEVRPAPRALAHQQAYCLSSAFTVCPTFQDWARREAAHARSTPDSARARSIPDAAAQAFEVGGEAASDASDSEARDSEAAHGAPDSGAGSHRNPARDWASPPPWMSAAQRRNEESDDDGDDRPDVSPILPRGGGLSGSFADRIAAGGSSARPSSDGAPEETVPGRSEATPTPPPGPAFGRPLPRDDDEDEQGPDDPDAKRHEPPRRVRSADRGSDGRAAPSWERAPRREAYPMLKTRMGLAGVTLPPILLGIVALTIAAIGIFFLPAILGIGNQPQASTEPSASAAASDVASSATPFAPTAIPAPTAQVYMIQANDTMSRIANRFGVPLTVLCDANKTTIPNCDRVNVGQQIIIPATAPTLVPDAGASPSTVASPSP